MDQVLVDIKAFRDGAYQGYATRFVTQADDELTKVGPGEPCGEYLRRFWHPVAMTSELADLPTAIRILGEDLVLFRDKSGRIGLVHKRCPHRRASLEFGSCDERGIRCCYHGWHFDLDGTLLDAPGQPKEAMERLKNRVKLGAYPAFEYKGLIFAYMGPVAEVPEFPVLRCLRFLRHGDGSLPRPRLLAIGCKYSMRSSIPSTPASCIPALVDYSFRRDLGKSVRWIFLSMMSGCWEQTRGVSATMCGFRVKRNGATELHPGRCRLCQ